MLETKKNNYLSLIFKSCIEFLPIFVFVCVYKIDSNFFYATYALIISTILYTIYTVKKQKRIPYLAVFLSIETTLFGSLTIIFQNPDFLQLRDTLYDVVLATLILFTALLGNPIIKKFFGHIFKLENDDWISLSYV